MRKVSDPKGAAMHVLQNIRFVEYYACFIAYMISGMQKEIKPVDRM